MSLALLVSCDDTWDDGRMPCRASLPHVLADGIDNRPGLNERADRAGWSLGEDGKHRCAPHTARHAASLQRAAGSTSPTP